MGLSSTYALPWPEIPDDANGPDQLEALAVAVERLLTTGTLKMRAGTIEAANPTADAHPVTLGYLNAKFLIGPADQAPAAGSVPAGTIYFGV